MSGLWPVTTHHVHACCPRPTAWCSSASRRSGTHRLERAWTEGPLGGGTAVTRATLGPRPFPQPVRKSKTALSCGAGPDRSLRPGLGKTERESLDAVARPADVAERREGAQSGSKHGGNHHEGRREHCSGGARRPPRAPCRAGREAPPHTPAPGSRHASFRFVLRLNSSRSRRSRSLGCPQNALHSKGLLLPPPPSDAVTLNCDVT